MAVGDDVDAEFATPTARPSPHRVLRRTDVYLLPFLSLLFLLNSLDRSNIGNAESAGFTKYAGLQERDLNDAVAAFFFVFVALQPVGAALGKRVGVARWVGGVMVGWGILTVLTAWVNTRGQLIFLRTCIGMLEAGFYPTTVFYLSLFYTRYEFAQRLGLFYGQSAVAGAFGGFVSYGVFSLFPSDDTQEAMMPQNSWHSYQVLFVLEGFLTVAVALAAFYWLPKGPGSAWWLSPEEKDFAERRVLADRQSVSSGTNAGDGGYHTLVQDSESESESEDFTQNETIPGQHHRRRRTHTPTASATTLLPASSQSRRRALLGNEAALTRADVLEAFTDWKLYHILVVNILSSIPTTAFSIFLPLIIKGLNHTPLTANLLTVPPFLMGAVTLWVVTFLSDHYHVRFPFVLAGLSVNVIGLTLAVLLPLETYTARYFAMCVLLAGSYIASPLTVAWITANIHMPGKRAVALGINGWGNFAGVLAAWIFVPNDGPAYSHALKITLSAVLMSMVGYAAFAIILWVENNWRRRKIEAGIKQAYGWRAAFLRRVVGSEWTPRGEERWEVFYGY